MTGKTFLSFISGILFVSCTFQPRAEWVSTTERQPWKKQPPVVSITPNDTTPLPELIVNPARTAQKIDGFGACFNELGWLSLSKLKPETREDIMEELFFPGVGANFNICRMPMGANDFSRDWYSYNETDGDFEMENFTIANDQQTLIPFIRNAQKYCSNLQIWASPWSPPSWMKYNKHYACAYTSEQVNEKYRNGLPIDKTGKEGTDMFIQEEPYLQAYARYFARFIEAYRQQGIPVFAVMPQNEFNSCQIFPSCTWTAASLANFIGNYLGPEMEKLDVDIIFGTMERDNESLADTILTDEKCLPYIKGAGFQWAGKGAISGIHKRYPEMKLYQTEQECGDGNNTWAGAVYSWNLMRHYLNNGTSAYMYWNISLEKGGISRWGWAQNSLVIVNSEQKSFSYSNEYYVLKHVSHYVQPGARRIELSGTFENALAFVNPDESIAIILSNELPENKQITIEVNGRLFTPTLQANSFNTLFIE